MPATLNLSNEVVKMRSEVKRLKVLVIRKLTRQIEALKKKKGAPADLERNQRRAARLLEEVRVLKALAPDVVTKTALQSDISFEKVCQNKDASLTERATARVASHPDFSKKIRSIKSAIEAFKAERTGAAEKKRPRDEEASDPDLNSDEEEESPEDEGSDSGLISESEKRESSEETEQNEEALRTTDEESPPPEVSRMRKEVKKLRILVIRKLTQEVNVLKKATPEESERQRNQERAALLQKEIQVLRGLQPDAITRRALEGNEDLEKVLQDPESGPEERAAVRLATHPRFVKKLQDVRVAIEDDKVKAVKAEEKRRSKEDESQIIKGEDDDGGDEDETDLNKDADEIKTEDPHLKEPVEPKSVKPKPPTQKLHSGETKYAVKSPGTRNSPKTVEKTEVIKKNLSKTKEPATASKQAAKPLTKKPENTDYNDDGESDLSDSEDEEKEYFDDSTEERFHKQSSHSEQSDDDGDDFFLGKVSKFKKKRSSSGTSSKAKTDEMEHVAKSSEAPAFRMQSVFCSALSKTSVSQKGKAAGSKPPRFQNQKHSDGKPSWFKSQDSRTDKRQIRNQAPGFRERGSRQNAPANERRGPASKPAFDRQNNKAGKQSQQALHPSWEASRKRKEQQAQITAFQGKKIKFDLDD